MKPLSLPRPRSLALAALASLTLLTSACSRPLVETQPTAAPQPAVEIIATAQPAAPQGLISRREDVKLATIQIVSKGTFVELGDTEAQSSAGSGSGFIIDEGGVAITNNHVVTGAALIEVYVGGEDEPRNARVLGVSECSDLAVIDIEGDGFSYLEWFDGELAAGMDVYTAGFPLGDPEYTITKGVVSKERADGESSWASVEEVLEHDATIRPGNSGGPLITDDGQVLGVNYAGFTGGPYYAIGGAEALAVIDSLRDGENVTSLGLNGRAVKTDSVSGIWASSIASGSPLDSAGLKPGDFITRLEGLEMATDGTMADYCQILRSRDADAVLNIQVYRPATEELLEGQVNGRPLERVSEPTPEPTVAPTAQPTPVADASLVLPIDPATIDVAQAREAAAAARGQYRQLVFETFDRGWTTRRSWVEDGDSILRDNFYRLIVREADLIRSVYWQPEQTKQVFGDTYLIEVDVAFDTKGATGGVGISFDGQSNGDGLSFVISSDNTWRVVGFVDDAYATQYSSKPAPTSAIIDGVNQLRVWRTPDGISFWINNTPVGVLEASPFSGGYAGVAALGGPDVSGPITLISDNFRALAK